MADGGNVRASPGFFQGLVDSKDRLVAFSRSKIPPKTSSNGFSNEIAIYIFIVPSHWSTQSYARVVSPRSSFANVRLADVLGRFSSVCKSVLQFLKIRINTWIDRIDFWLIYVRASVFSLHFSFIVLPHEITTYTATAQLLRAALTIWLETLTLVNWLIDVGKTTQHIGEATTVNQSYSWLLVPKPW